MFHLAGLANGKGILLALHPIGNQWS